MTETRTHLSIGEVLSLVQVDFPDVTISKIRFLESQGLIDPERTPSGYRRFYSPDVQRLRWILAQQRDRFLPLKVIKQHLDAGEYDIQADATLFENLEVSVPEPLSEQPAEAEATPRPAPVAPEVEDFSVHDVMLGAARRVVEPVEQVDQVEQVTPEIPAVPEPEPPRASAPVVTSDAGPLDVGVSSMSMTVDELAKATGLTPSDLAELERYGLLKTHSIGPAVYYEGEALVVARLAAGFLRHGVEARHLRMYRTSAEREAGVFEQVVMPFIKQRSSSSRREAREILVEMARLGEALHAAMLREALRGHTEGR